MSQVYLFCLVLGGGLAALSVLGDALDVGGDVDLDAADVDAAEAEAPDADAEKAFSLRGLVYGVFGFGLTGTVLGWLGYPAAAPTTLAFSGVAGVGSGWVTARLVGWLRSTETGGHAGERSFEGRPGRVVLPLEPGSPGRVKVRRGERSFELRALPYDRDADDSGGWEDVVVVEMREGIAYVSPVDGADDLRLTS